MFILTELIYLKFKLPAELTRKFLHFFIGVICAVYMDNFQSHFPVLILSLLFYAILWFGKKFRFMQCIHNVKRKSYGGVIYPLSIYVIFLLNNLGGYPYFPFKIAILVLSISDPLATFGGVIIPENLQGKIRLNAIVQSKTKTVLGSLLFFISALIIVFWSLNAETVFSLTTSLLFALLISVISTVAEYVSKNGWDNFFVPFMVWILLILLGT